MTRGKGWVGRELYRSTNPPHPNRRYLAIRNCHTHRVPSRSITIHRGALAPVPQARFRRAQQRILTGQVVAVETDKLLGPPLALGLLVDVEIARVTGRNPSLHAGAVGQESRVVVVRGGIDACAVGQLVVFDLVHEARGDAQREFVDVEEADDWLVASVEVLRMGDGGSDESCC